MRNLCRRVFAAALIFGLWGLCPAQNVRFAGWFERVFGPEISAERAKFAAEPRNVRLLCEDGYRYGNRVLCAGEECTLTADHSYYGEGSRIIYEWVSIDNGGERELERFRNMSSCVWSSGMEGENLVYVSVSDEGEEIGRDTVRIYVTHVPADFEVVPDTVCYGMGATIGVTGEPAFWAWDTSYDAIGTEIPRGETTRFINVRPRRDSWYPVRISLYPVVSADYRNTCYLDTLSWVKVFDTAQFSVTGPSGGCVGLPIELEAVDCHPDSTVYWNGVPGAGKYTWTMEQDTVLAVYATDRYGCRGTFYKPLALIARPDGEILAYIEDDILLDSSSSDYVCLGKVLRLEAYSEQADHFKWYTRDTAQTIEIFPKSDFTAYCDFTVGTGKACYVRVERKIRVENCNKVYFPTGFVLNGFSKTFGPIGVQDTAREYFFAVFERSGTMVFSTTEFSQGWDGTYKGKLVPPGIYSYIFREKYEQLEWVTRGTVTVIQ